jgi:transposase
MNTQRLCTKIASCTENDETAQECKLSDDQERKRLGHEIASLANIEKTGDHYIVPSQFNPMQPRHKVWIGDPSTCTCHDYETRRGKCKHIYAVEEFLRSPGPGRLCPAGMRTVSVKRVRKTYPQHWPAYNEAQTNEKRQFQVLLHDLCADLDELPVAENRRSPQGRKPIPLSDALFAAVFKVYSTVSARRFASDLEAAKDVGHIPMAPHFNSVLSVLANPAVYPKLIGLIERSSVPLAGVESSFAVDSTGFAYSRFVRWYDIKYNRFSAEQQWIKAHICTGTKTNVITAVEIHRRDEADQTQLPALVESTAKNFNMAEVSADKAYSDRKCFDAIDRVGAKPFIMFKSNTTGKVGGLFQKAFHYFQFNRDEFLAHYHRRSNVESTVMMVKSKFGDAVRSKSEVAARNEVLAKILCHNICCLISAMYELGIAPTFAKAA